MGLDYVLKILRQTGTVERKVGSGRQRSTVNCWYGYWAVAWKTVT